MEVARSLIDVARVMELQDNTEGILDLYRAAHAIYPLQLVSSDFDSVEDAAAILQLVPSLLDQERSQEARAYLTKCLASAEKRSSRRRMPESGQVQSLVRPRSCLH